MKRKNKFLAILVTMLLVALPASVSALNLGNVLRDGAMAVAGGALVTAVAGPINDFINTVTFNRGAKLDGHTKVVPIISLGNGTRVGAAQVGGNLRRAVDQTKAVAQLETTFQGIRATILIPVDSINPVRQFRRVQGVGVTAIIDARI
ncbi:MAG: hypothetical protein KBH12_06605 [Synergistaceae bacterium]|nr:hypothetical protein [Synergistaceae bacterium]MBP9626403.1 hypothetical protein [Synergistaceae bacterium]MBP9956956.1 hypothetical protein [Synergistaceae bacterium]